MWLSLDGFFFVLIFLRDVHDEFGSVKSLTSVQISAGHSSYVGTRIRRNYVVMIWTDITRCSYYRTRTRDCTISYDYMDIWKIFLSRTILLELECDAHLVMTRAIFWSFIIIIIYYILYEKKINLKSHSRYSNTHRRLVCYWIYILEFSNAENTLFCVLSLKVSDVRV